MRIGILGLGLMGGKLGTIFVRAGHDVVFSYSRSERKLKRLAKRQMSPGLSTGIALWQSARMSRDDVIEKLREHEAELKAAGVVHLRLHGSYARQTQVEASSDIDLIAEFELERRYTLIDMVRLENRLRDLLGVRVDLSPSHTLKDPVRRKAELEAVLAF